MVRVCVVGCLHGSLDRVYVDIAAAERVDNFKTDLVLCCGDFQSLRNPADLSGMSVPPKYYSMGDFWRYYSEEVRAPVLTLFIGGNHEASAYLQELPYGGWVAPNIWYMGYASVVQFCGLRIAGLSGIYKQHDYTMGHYEHPPYSEATKRSVYHVRNLDVFRLGQIRRPLDVVLSHDWPRGVYHYGDSRGLINRKRHFKEEIQADALGSPPAEQLLCRIRPRYWFSAHLHCKFAAFVKHSDPNSKHEQPQFTRFLALDKCLPKKDYLQFLDITPDHPSDVISGSSYIVSNSSCQASESPAVDVPAPILNDSTTTTDQYAADDDDDESSDSDGFFLDPEWLCVLRSTNHFMSTSRVPCILPEESDRERCDFSVSDAELLGIHDLFADEFAIPENFERTAPIYKPHDPNSSLTTPGVVSSTPRTLTQLAAASKPQIFSNPQTELLCAMLDLINPNATLLGRESYSLLELSSQLEAKKAEEQEDEEEEEGCVPETKTEVTEEEAYETGVMDVSSNPTADVEASWMTTDYSCADDDRDEYDPLQSVCLSPTHHRAANPEEVNVDVSDEDAESADASQTADKTNNVIHGTAYSPTCIADVKTGELSEKNENDVQEAAYVPSMPMTNEEEIQLPDTSEDEGTM